MKKNDNVVKFYPKNAAKDPDAVLEQSIGEYENVFIIGWNKDGDIDPRADLGLDGKTILWLIESFKLKLLNGDYS